MASVSGAYLHCILSLNLNEYQNGIRVWSVSELYPNCILLMVDVNIILKRVKCYLETQSYAAWDVWCNVFALSMFMIHGCNVCAYEMICCIAVWLRKINPWMPLRMCWIFMSWSWSTGELFLREISSVVRAMPCTTCKICSGNPEKFDDFYRGLIVWNLFRWGFKWRTVGISYGIS